MRNAPVLALIALAIGATRPEAAHAETIHIPCDPSALVDAITIANTNAEEDDLWLAAACVYAPPKTLVMAADAGHPVTIYGNGAAISGSDARTVFMVNAGATLQLDDVTITKGYSSGDFGAGIRNQGTLTLTDCTVFDNSAIEGFGGGIYSMGTLRLLRSTVSGNSAAFGGGIYSVVSMLTLIDSMVSFNTAGFGGGINTNFGPAALSNSTVFGNSASFGGGINNGIDATMTLNHVTVSGNSAISSGGGVFNHGQLALDNTVIANSTSGGDCSNGFGASTPTGANLIEDGSCNVAGALSGDPRLGKPTGSPAYLPLLKESPAIDAADGASCPGVDQRGALRPQDGNKDKVATCDLGAYEVAKKKKGTK